MNIAQEFASIEVKFDKDVLELAKIARSEGYWLVLLKFGTYEDMWSVLAIDTFNNVSKFLHMSEYDFKNNRDELMSEVPDFHCIESYTKLRDIFQDFYLE